MIARQSLDLHPVLGHAALHVPIQCVAVSTSSDATGTYNRYSFAYSTTSPTTQRWASGRTPTTSPTTCSTPMARPSWARRPAPSTARDAGGAAATQQCFTAQPSYGGLLPSDLDGTTAPPAGSPNYLLEYGTTSLDLWKFHVDWTNAANSTFTGPTNSGRLLQRGLRRRHLHPAAGHDQSSSTRSADRADVPPGLPQLRDGHESLVVNHSVTQRQRRVGVRWYELRSPERDADGLPAGHVCARRQLPLDGQHRDGQGGRHRASATASPAARSTPASATRGGCRATRWTRWHRARPRSRRRRLPDRHAAPLGRLQRA